MKIAESQLSMAASHREEKTHEERETLRTSGSVPDALKGAAVALRKETLAALSDFSEKSAKVSLSAAAKGLAAGLANAGNASPAQAAAPQDAAQLAKAAAKPAAEGVAQEDPELDMLRMAVELLTGRKAALGKVLDLARGQGGGGAGARGGFGLSYDYEEKTYESEETSFAASGTVKTADGKEIGFSLSISMSREYSSESSFSLRLGAGGQKLEDPLVLNFNGKAAELSDVRFEFDLTGDGKKESLNYLKPGSAFLVFDKNKDGVANDGSELFGAISGDGFAELAALDEDGNGWIDENDSAWQDLRLWRPAEGGGRLQTLAEAGVGALALAHKGTPFSLKDGNNGLLGKIQSSGVFLKEDGEAGTIQKVDLTV